MTGDALAANERVVEAVAEKLWNYNAYIERLWIPDSTAPYENAVKWNDEAAVIIAKALIAAYEKAMKGEG